MTDQAGRAQSLEIAPVNRIVPIGAAYVMKGFETTLLLTGAVAYTVTIPTLSRAAGKFFSFRGSAGLAASVTIAAPDSPAGWANGTISATTDRLTLYCDGIEWFEIIDTGTNIALGGPGGD